VTQAQGEDFNPTKYDATPNDALQMLYNAAPLRVLATKKEHELKEHELKEHELFNLRDTGVELLRN